VQPAAPKTSAFDQAISGRNRHSNSSATAHSLPAMPLGQNLSVEQGTLQPYDTGEMSPIRKKEEADAAAKAALAGHENPQDTTANPTVNPDAPKPPSGGPTVKKRLADLIP